MMLVSAFGVSENDDSMDIGIVDAFYASAQSVDVRAKHQSLQITTDYTGFCPALD
jgi:hypothetical protein